MKQTSLPFPPALWQMNSGGAPGTARVSCGEKSCCEGLGSTLALGLVQGKEVPPLPLDTQKIRESHEAKAGLLIFKTSNFETFVFK